MSDSLSFLEIAEKALNTIGKPMSASEIWALAKERNWKTDSVGVTPWATIAAQIYVSIKNDPHTPFRQVSKRPTRFVLTPWGEAAERAVAELNSLVLESENVPLKERELHPALAKFVYSNSHFRAYVKTIYHEVSIKSIKGRNLWLHPDLVGVRFNFDEYKKKQSTYKINRKSGLLSILL